MTAKPSLTAELRAEVNALEDDLRARLAALPEVNAEWRAQHREASAVGRTGVSWQEWSEDRITQAAVAWVLATVFVRFAEDNSLVKPVWISGPRSRRAEAMDAQAAFLREEARTNPDVTDREWLLQPIHYFRVLPATEELVGATSALWLVTPSGDAASRLLAFWRERDDQGGLVRDLSDEDLGTRFLGDLYQDLSEEAKSRYALLQTPMFVEEFILDRTLEPALKERPLDGFKMIDPTCGSGHFLLGTFRRLLDRWEAREPGLDARARVQKALDAIHGVDLNPFAVAIARFRLTIAAMQASGDRLIENAPGFAYHLAVGDSLLHGRDEFELGLGMGQHKTAGTFAYHTESLPALQEILRNGRYDVVVGNPPYITVKDPALNAEYRRRDVYRYLKGQYQLTVPFMERFFDLALAGERAGWVGQITGNAFMKREFGSPIIERFLPVKDLRIVVDASGVHVPHHGTPTVLLIGRNTRPLGRTVRTILGIRRDPQRPEDPARAPVWSAISRHIDEPGYIDEWIAVVDLDRTLLASHPWSLTGGGTVELMQAIEAAANSRLSMFITEIGRTTHTGADDAYYMPDFAFRTRAIEQAVPVVLGVDVRDFALNAETWTAFPYDQSGLPAEPDAQLAKFFWMNRTLLSARIDYQQTLADRGLRWFDHSMFFPKRYSRPLSIAFAFVATHNHFVLDHGGKVFNRSAPVIKLSLAATEEDHWQLVGMLNSSVALFWLKQQSYDKGSGGINEGIKAEAWERFYEFTGTTLRDYPLTPSFPRARGRALSRLGEEMARAAPSTVVRNETPTRETLRAARVASEAARAQMISVQEELDWEVYRLYRLIDEDLTYAGADPPALTLGERAFEIVLARRVLAGVEETAWFERHGSTSIIELPDHWPTDYRDLVERRIALIESHAYIRLLERPEYKRRWALDLWEKQEERALRGWLLDRLENREHWFDRSGTPTPRSVAQLADELTRDSGFASVLALWEGRPDVPVVAGLQRLLAKEAVPFLAASRYKDSGLRKREAWEEAWAKQRRQDAGEAFGESTKNGRIAAPPKYTSADFARKEYWDHRGKFDVPKERFILYPGAGLATDPTPVLGWAGWDHAQQAFAIDTLIQRLEAEGRADEDLIPLVAGLAELLPWVQQWHAEPDDFYGGSSPADFFAELLAERSKQVERTREQLATWRPAAPGRGRARKVTTR